LAGGGHLPRFELAFRLPDPDHLLTVGIEGVVDDPLSAVDLVVVAEAEMAKAFGDGFQARSLRLPPELVVGVRAVDDLAEQRQRRIAGQPVLVEDGLKRG
jgi:hypothetical protein